MFVSHLKPIRHNRKISASTLAVNVGVSENIIRRIEDGKYIPSLELAINISKELDANIFDLFIFC